MRCAIAHTCLSELSKNNLLGESMKKIPKNHILNIDPYLTPYKDEILLRQRRIREMKKRLLGRGMSLSDFADGYLYFGFHRTADGWVYREWAPGADALYLTGDFNGWQLYLHPMKRIENGVFELYLEGRDALSYGQYVQTVVVKDGRTLRRVPLYATRVVQDKQTYLWCARLDDTMGYFPWTDSGFKPEKTPLIYECHIGMATEEYRVGTYLEFAENILPRVKALGYNTIQLMAIMEHPYYASFGYQVTSFFAPSSRYGESADLKALIDKAHSMGIAVLLDVVHSHSAKNTEEGICEFDGTTYQFFHDGARGEHPAWGTRLFNYGKGEVIHFLLSNLKYWLEVFHFDGFRFDGVTSMLYRDHGLGSAFVNYSMYFSENTDYDAVIYLALANELIHNVKPSAITVAEDMSGMPGMCIPASCGGIGFDFRLSMGVPDMWIKTIKEGSEREWDIFRIWYELNERRPREKNIGYCESHDQALVGDKTLMFRLCDAEMYERMSKSTPSAVIDRGMVLHKMIRLITATLAGEGYLNFMGNEFGHPEWIDFPREGNGYSHHYCRRQWSLADRDDLRYGELLEFDKAMISLLRDKRILEKRAKNKWMHADDKVIVYTVGDTVFAFNFHPERSYEGYFIPVDKSGEYRVILSTDSARFGGARRVDERMIYRARKPRGAERGFLCYLPSRSAIVFERLKSIKPRH